MLKYLLDTNMVIYTMKNRPQQVKRRFLQHHGRMGISAVTLGELVFGVEHSQQVERNLADIEALAARIEVLPFDDMAALSIFLAGSGAWIMRRRKRPEPVQEKNNFKKN